MKHYFICTCLVSSFITVYIAQDTMSGFISIEVPTEMKHEGIFMTIEGAVDLQISSQNVGAFDAFYNSVKVFDFVTLY